MKQLQTDLIDDVMPFMDADANIDLDVKQCSLFGLCPNYKDKGRIEPLFMGCGRLVLEGRRLVWCISVKDAMTAKMNLVPHEPVNSITELIGFIFRLSQLQVSWMKDHGLFIYHKMQFPGTMLFMPPGYIVFERTTTKAVVGVKLSGFDFGVESIVSHKLLREALGATDPLDPSHSKTLEHVASYTQHVTEEQMALKMIAPPPTKDAVVAKTPATPPGAPHPSASATASPPAPGPATLWGASAASSPAASPRGGTGSGLVTPTVFFAAPSPQPSPSGRHCLGVTTPIGYDGAPSPEASPRGAPASGLATPIGAVASSVVELHGALEKAATDRVVRVSCMCCISV